MRIRETVSVLVLMAMSLSSEVGWAQGQTRQSPCPRIVALDPFTLDWLKPRLSDESIGVLTGGLDESFDVVAERAWSMRNAEFLVFHRDRLQPLSLIFCERLKTQGVRSIDLKELGVTHPCDCGRHDDSRLVHPVRRSDPDVALRATLAVDLSGKGAGQ